MTSAPVRQELTCPACSGRFVVQLCFSDFPGEPHRKGRCPSCQVAGTAPTGTVAEPATFVARGSAATDGAIELVMSSSCVDCQAFLVDRETSCRACGLVSEARARAWRRRLDDPHLRTTYHCDAGDLTMDTTGAAELRERGEIMYFRGQPSPWLAQLQVWTGRVTRERARRVASLVLDACIPRRTGLQSLLPGEYPASVKVEHPEGSLGTLGAVLSHGARLDSPPLSEVASMLSTICQELQASSPSGWVPNPNPERARERSMPVTKRAVPALIEPVIERVVVPVIPPVIVPVIVPVIAAVIPPVIPPVIAKPPRRARAADHPTIPADECALCSTDSPFAGRVATRDGDIYTVHHCPSCREDFTVFRPALQSVVEAWIEQDAVQSAVGLDVCLAEVLRDPRSDVPRLRFAAVVASVDPVRAELIRAQLGVARQRRCGQRDEAQALQRHDLLADGVRLRRWYAGVDALVESRRSCMTIAQLQFGRGFVEGVCLTAQQFVERAAAILRIAPIIDVGITTLGDASAALFASPHLAQVRSLCLYGTGATDADVRRLAASPHLARLAYLDLGYCKITDAGVEALCASTSLAGLRYVRLSDNPAFDPNPSFDEQDGRRYGLIATATSEELRARFGLRRWLDSRYTSAEPPNVETFP